MANVVRRAIVLELVVTDPLDDPAVGLYMDDAERLGSQWEETAAAAIAEHPSTHALRSTPGVRTVSVL